jgi:hypothetical protein
MTSSSTGRTVFIGIDNGPSGSIGIQVYNVKGMKVEEVFMKTPTYMRQDYTKKKKRLSQIDFKVLRPLLKQYRHDNVHAVMERPLVNPGRWVASCVGLRVHQQWLDLFDFYHLPEPASIDSKEWQKVLLPKGTTGEELKTRSKEIGHRLFPKACRDVKHGDCDGMLICEFLRRRNTLA